MLLALHLRECSWLRRGLPLLGLHALLLLLRAAARLSRRCLHPQLKLSQHVPRHCPELPELRAAASLFGQCLHMPRGKPY